MSILNLRTNWTAGVELLDRLRTHRQLTWEMTRRELTERYSGQFLGALWTFFHPAVQIGVYIYVFSVVFAIKMGGSQALPRDYTTYLLAGLLPWMACAEAMAKGTGVLVGNAGLVK